LLARRRSKQTVREMGPIRETRGDFRDKVAAPDPSTVSPTADAEAAGTPTSEADGMADDLGRARHARAAVPRLDPNRAVAADSHPGMSAKFVIPGIGVVVVLLFTAALVMSLRW
jgi:hypothetical protein